MAKTIKPDQLAAAIAETLKTYASATDEQVQRAIKKTGEEGEKYIKGQGNYNDRRTKGYRNKFYLKKTKKGYVLANKDYPLTHLLEKGHAIKRGGGYSPAFPHWQQTEEYVQELILQKIKEEIGK